MINNPASEAVRVREEIMAIPCDPPDSMYLKAHQLYRGGHKDALNAAATLAQQAVAKVERERDDALACLRRCGVAASNLLDNPEGITPQAQHALDNPLEADQLVNDRIASLECHVAQTEEKLSTITADLAAKDAKIAELRDADAMIRAIERIIPRNDAHRDYAETVQVFVEKLTAAMARGTEQTK